MLDNRIAMDADRAARQANTRKEVMQMFHVSVGSYFVVRSADIFWLMAVSITFHAPIVHTWTGVEVWR